MLCACVATTALTAAEPVAITPRARVVCPGSANGAAEGSVAVPLGGGSILVAVVAAGANPATPSVQWGGSEIPGELIGYDPVSRLGLIKMSGNEVLKAVAWLDEAGGNANAVLRTMEPGGNLKCRTTGWVKQVDGRVLPFALLGVSFDRAVPPPGTPIVDDAGDVVGIVFQGSGNANNGYAIPAEVVHRVKRDLTRKGKLVRGWLGLGLQANNRLPQITSVVADSPAAKAGVQVNDVIVGIGSRQITDYADAANAFFYLIPGEAVSIRLRRNTKQFGFSLTPTEPRS